MTSENKELLKEKNDKPVLSLLNTLLEQLNKDELQSLVEDLTGAAAPEIATTDEDLSLYRMFQQTEFPSLAREIFPTWNLHGPTGALFNIQKKGATNDFELVRSDVEVYPSDSIQTGLTKEVIHDINQLYGPGTTKKIIGGLLRGLTNDDENDKCNTFLSTNATASGVTVTLTDPNATEQTVFEISQAVQELVLEMNSKTFRTYGAFIVLPYKYASAFFYVHSYKFTPEVPHSNFISSISTMRYYKNPDPTSTTAYVGLRDLNDDSRSTGVFSPFSTDIIPALDFESGKESYTIFHRYAMTISPLHADDPMLYSFTIA